MASFSVGGSQLGFGDPCWDGGWPGLRRGGGGPIGPGASVVVMLGLSARTCADADLIPRAEARFDAMEEDISRGGMRRGNVDVVLRLTGLEVSFAVI